MELSTKILPYIEGKEFSELIKMKIEENGEIKDRMDFVEEIVQGKKVIHVGCLDHLPLIEDKIRNNRWFHNRITKISSECLGIDINQEGIEFVKSKFDISNICYGDIECEQKIQSISSKYWDYIVFGEILEHVNNPVSFLKSLIYKYEENIGSIIITVPNAFRAGNIKSIFQNLELINSDHRYWFSPYTIWKIVHQAGLQVEAMQMCQFSATSGLKGKVKNIVLKRYPLMAEDIVVICRRRINY